MGIHNQKHLDWLISAFFCMFVLLLKLNAMLRRLIIFTPSILFVLLVIALSASAPEILPQPDPKFHGKIENKRPS